MKAPFTIEQFLHVFRDYNEAVFPIQLIFYLISLIVIYLAIKPHPLSGRIISGILSFFWFWMGIVYHIVFFSTINKAAYLFGSFFVIQGILFLIFGVFENRLFFQFQKNTYGIAGLILIVFAQIIYPILGYFTGHVYPYSPLLACHALLQFSLLGYYY
jgi:hypothetical protein